MKAIWSGSLRFVLLNIPVNLYSASKERVFNFDLFHQKDFGPIRYAKICKKEEKEVPFEEIIKGYEYEKDKFVYLTDEDFENANLERTKIISIVGFTKISEIDPIFFEKPYFLEPQEGAEKSYLLLRESLKQSKKVGLAEFVLKNREHLGIIQSSENCLVLNQLRFQDEIAKTRELKIPEGKAEKNELNLVLELISRLSRPFKASEYKDDYSKEIERVIHEKAAGKIPKAKGKIPEPTAMPDLMKILKESLKK